MNGGQDLTGFHRYDVNAYTDAFDFACAETRENRFLLRRLSAVAKGQENDAVAIPSNSIVIAVVGEIPLRSYQQR
jgi:hypothetical protein